MNDHIPDATKMISDSPRTDAHNWKDGDYDDPLHAFYDFAGQLERELNEANAIIRQQQLLDEENLRLQDRIKRLEEMYEGKIGENEQFLGSNLQGLLTRELNAANERIKRLEKAGDELMYDNDDMANINRWHKAKEAKP
jgi:hypothetical protein